MFSTLQLVPQAMHAHRLLPRLIRYHCAAAALLQIAQASKSTCELYGEILFRAWKV